MNVLTGKKIILGVTGSIAAYKSALLTRLFVKNGAVVQPILTRAATTFITPLTMATLAQRNVITDFSEEHSGEWHSHIELGIWADAFVIAPASANTMAKAASGLCDNLLTAVYLSSRAPVFWAPAMDMDMYLHKATTANIEKLKNMGDRFIDPDTGFLASGLSGPGRMAKPEAIVKSLSDFFSTKLKYQGLRLLITAGPTHEAIDPVRFLGNHSSGKTGVELAKMAAQKGAEVVIVAGPGVDVSSLVQYQQITIVHVTSANQMFEASEKHHRWCNAAIFAAAVADFRPETFAENKMKRNGEITLKLVPNPDIAALLGANKEDRVHFGFALETDNLTENAKSKLERKNFDAIALNSPGIGKGFGADNNEITILTQTKSVYLGLKPKTELANDILEVVYNLAAERGLLASNIISTGTIL